MMLDASTSDQAQTAAESEELLAAWQLLYRFSAFALTDPRRADYGRWDEIRRSDLLEQAAAIVRSTPAAAADSCGPCELPIEHLKPAAVLAELPPDHAAWNQAYEDTFGLLVASGAPAYETEYISGKLAFQRSNTLADLAGFYRAFGLDIPRDCPERVDHIALQLEFMACLAELERCAAAEDSERASICRSARTRFFQEHLGWWGVGFARLLRQDGNPAFYREVGTFLAALLTAQRAAMGIQPSERIATPQDPDEIGSCDDCLAANL